MGVLVEKIQHGWGYDGSGRWHRGIVEVGTIRKRVEVDRNDPLASARGVMWGLLFSAVFWLLVGGIVALWWRR